eukprot:10221921-Alexandrium_andersonii.AAC.1
MAPRSWQQLFRAVHQRAAPAAATWHQVLGDITAEEFRARWLREWLVAAEIACWNLRWLVDQSTQQAASKKAVLARHLGQGRVCLLRETHSDALAAAEWAAALPCQRALASVAAAAGPKKPGGVAILIPVGWQ